MLWPRGLVNSYTMGGFNILLMPAIVVILIRVIQGRSPVVGGEFLCFGVFLLC